ncbi:hypothetical protein [Cellulosimicrobium sp. CUA-896]|uniref:hypothetical protein n=1 Tax=Cellulosimicrobium sp. CUA-896 TaxID=1517881 RepID=UPI000962E506|nr:hypothetical protein [Cellulosimicrobium sp. CUA-896]OLT53192.1 hypothetical protein BJF88_12945 [Cellulosimicrobium sp. CUA-896]
MPDHRPLFSSPGTTTAPDPAERPRTRRADRVTRLEDLDLGLAATGRPRQPANAGDELTVDPADRRRRARAALLDLRRDVIRRSAGY